MISRAAALLLLLAVPAAADDLAFVTSQSANSVTIVNLTTAETVIEVPVAGAPAPVAYDPAHGRAYVIAAETGVLTALDESGGLLWRKELGEGAFGLAIAPDGGLFVTNWFHARLTRYDARLNALWSAPTGKSPAGVASGQDGRLVAVADRDDNQVSIFDAETGQRKAIVKTGIHPYAVAFHDEKIWTTDVKSDSVTVIDPKDACVIGQIATGSHPYGIAFAGGRGFVTNQYAGSLTVFDAETLQPVTVLPTDDYPEGIAALPDGRGVAVVHWDSSTLTIVDAQDFSTRHSLDMPDGPRSFGVFTGRQVQ